MGGAKGDSPIFVASCHRNRDSPRAPSLASDRDSSRIKRDSPIFVDTKIGTVPLGPRGKEIGPSTLDANTF